MFDEFFKSPNQNDQGQYIFANGDRYIGEWRDDKKNGYCRYKNIRGVTIFEGYWKDDKLHKRNNEIKSRTHQYPVIESEQINPAKSCFCGFDFFYNPLKGILQSTVLPLIKMKVIESSQSGVDVDCNNKTITVSGFGTKVFSNHMGNVFLDPNDITLKEIVYFLENLFHKIQNKNTGLEKIEALKDYKITATSASVASFIALNCFLKDLKNNHNHKKREAF